MRAARTIGARPPRQGTTPIRSTLNRPAGPVVVTGGLVSRLAGAPVNRVVAFSASSVGWSQIPVQVDERLNTTVSAVYNGQFSGTNVPVNVYADAGTFVVALPNNFAPAEVQRITAQGLRPLTTTITDR